jgi:hypothetical protein
MRVYCRLRSIVPAAEPIDNLKQTLWAISAIFVIASPIGRRPAGFSFTIFI